MRAGISLGDSVAAMYGAIGALMALHARSLAVVAGRWWTWHCTRRCSA